MDPDIDRSWVDNRLPYVSQSQAGRLIDLRSHPRPDQLPSHHRHHDEAYSKPAPGYGTVRKVEAYAERHSSMSYGLDGKEKHFQSHMSSKKENKMIEVAPGLFMRLRGAEETYEAVKNDSYMPTMCVVCADTIFCIDSANHVLCPVCRVVSPVDEDSFKELHNVSSVHDPSVGLGFTLQQLYEMHAELMNA